MKKLYIIILLFLICPFLAANPGSETARKEGRKGEVYLFSAVKGTISLKGEPLEGIKLTRVYPKIGKSEDVTETIYTNEDGSFHFEEVRGKLGIMRFLPHEAVIHQYIKAEYLGKEYIVWYACKRNYEPLGEFKYYKKEPVLSPQMQKAYEEGYILLNSDLKSNEDFIQKVNDHIFVFSVTDLNFPYEEALKKTTEELITRENEFTDEVKKWFSDNPYFFDRITNGDEVWSERELKDLVPYIDTKVMDVESVNYSDHIKLKYFEEDYHKDIKRVTLGGEVILNLVNPDGKNLKARIWLYDSLFKVGRNRVDFEPREYNFMINSVNINPDITE